MVRPSVVREPPPCSPLGWRGFLLGGGNVWYDKTESGWEITSINNTSVETDKKPLLGWTIDKRIDHPSCFNRPWLSGDKFEEFSEIFAIANLEKFFKEPGLFMGSSISSFAPIKPSWCSKADDCKRISLVAQLEQCSAKNFDFEDRDGSVWIKDSSDGYNVEHQYQILGTISDRRCSELAPHIGVKCKKSYLIGVGEFHGGTMGWDFSYGIYGLFELPDLGPTIAPLIFFSNKNEALNYLEKIREHAYTHIDLRLPQGKSGRNK